MTRDEHLAIYREHRDAAAELLHKSILALRQQQYEDSRTLFDEYLAETRKANKHRGIADAMWTRQHSMI